MHVSNLKLLAAGAVLAASAFGNPTPVLAAGCGGYVNVFVSGCAPWDNNPRRMPGAPGYQAPRPSAQPTPRIIAPTVQSRIQPQPTVQRVIVAPPTGNRLITDNGAGLISPGNRTGIISNDGGGLRR